MGLSTVKQDIEEKIDYLTDCSELEFRAMYERLLGEINSFPVESSRDYLLIKIEIAKLRYQRERDQRYTFGDWRRLL